MKTCYTGFAYCRKGSYAVVNAWGQIERSGFRTYREALIWKTCGSMRGDWEIEFRPY